ncbi:unnamed protein product [Rotaria sp. Silwood2]|nr:unnamed protein product [Rotaria sp. Silwood2]CAF2629068.1 unnamed protein product [Rotaria sp. Silwood2]CAF2879223.1 unnamed protein product [Rotaria sp. Silwood2]CAF3041680.1 unnamed protein product [Rotaria sp. Silwood2]CAF3984454.1 unnamed protein product [Rotaria sp. Silwood2]
MATSLMDKKPCIKCDKGNGIIMCFGCEQSFCIKHILTHREDLTIQMDNIGQEHDFLRRDFYQEDNNTHPLLTQINTWELQSIVKIQIAAETARIILQQIINRNRNQMKMMMNKITHDLRSSRESNDYTEIELEKWTEQIKELRRLIDEPVAIDIIEDNHIQSSIRLIKIKENFNESLREFCSYNPEIFDQAIGSVTLSEKNLVATCSEPYYHYSSICGKNSYLTGTHRIRFRIENITVKNLFFGILTSSQQIIPWMIDSSSIYGWWGLEWIIINGKEQCVKKDNILKIGDEVTLVLNCENRQIQLEHHRTNRLAQLSVNIQKCPLPWKILVSLSNRNDCVRILH